MTEREFQPYRERFEQHTLKETYVTKADEVRSYFLHRPASTVNAVSIVMFMGAIMVSSPDLGGLVLQPFQPDPLKWLMEVTTQRDINAFAEAIPENVRVGTYVVTPEAHDATMEFVRGVLEGNFMTPEDIDADLELMEDSFNTLLDEVDLVLLDTYVTLWDTTTTLVSDGTVRRSDLMRWADFDDAVYNLFAALERLVRIKAERGGGLASVTW